jgi:ribonucleotide reductase beta subunit family protein with ferritin-like domain
MVYQIYNKMENIYIASYEPDMNYTGGTSQPVVLKEIEPLKETISFKNTLKSDSILHDDEEDYTFLPIKRSALIQHYYAQRNIHWVPADIDMSNDRNDFDRLTPEIQTFIKGLLGFFAPADGLVNENIFRNFQKDTSFWKEARFFYAEQASMETIHGEVYSLMATSLIRNSDELNDIFNSIKTYKSVAKIAEFMKKYMDRTYTLLERILAFACIEGILFNSAFAAIYWIKKKNILKGFCKANEFIARDEAIHFQFAITLYLMLEARDPSIKINVQRIYEIVDEAVKTNEIFIKEIIVAEMIGMSSADLLSYTKCIADAVLSSLGHPKLYNEENPFSWMAVIQLPNKTNFFEDKVSEYAQSQESHFVYDEDAYF